MGRLLAVWVSASTVLLAQFNGNDFQLPSGLSQFVANAQPDLGLEVSSEVVMSSDRLGLLTVNLRMNPGWKIYSLTQRAGGPPPTKIHLAANPKFRLVGSFSPKESPKSERSEIFEMKVETLSDSASWVVPIEVKGPVSELKISGYVEGLACFGQCVPLGKKSASFTTTPVLPKRIFMPIKRVPGAHAELMAQLSTGTAKPGKDVQLLISVRPDSEWHVYAYNQAPKSMFQKPLLVHTSLPEGWQQGEGRSSAAVLAKPGLAGEPPNREYVGPATIAVPISVPAETQAGEYLLSGHVALQTCSKTQCDRPVGLSWRASIKVGKPEPNLTGVPVRFGEVVSYQYVANLLLED